MSVRREAHHRDSNDQVVITLGTGLFGMGTGDWGYLAKTINESLMEIGVAVDDEMQEVFDEVGKEGAKKLRETSPVNEKSKQAGKYAKGWVYDKGKRTKNFRSVGVIKNKNNPQLTHILEYGHPLVRNGKVVGNVKEIPHIRPVADWVANEIDERLSKKLGGK